MSEATQYLFDHQEVVEMLLRKQNIRTGVWSAIFEMLQVAASVPTGPEGQTVYPASLNFIKRVGIRLHEGEPNNLTVDAASLYPKTGASKKAAKKIATKKASAKKQQR